MSLNIKQQYNSMINEKEELKERLQNLERRFSFLEKYLKYAADIKIARKQKKLIPIEKVFRELSI